jgi:hypothetical protein
VNAADPRLDRARAVADAVLYEGYLLYPYRSTAAKNQVRWQFGVLGPPGAAAAGAGEESDLAVQCLVHGAGAVGIRLRFLHLQERHVERADGSGGFTPVPELTVGVRTWLRWDEAVEREVVLAPFDLAPGATHELPVEIAGGEDVEMLPDAAGRLVRRRHPISATVEVAVRPTGPAAPDGGPLMRLCVSVRNTTVAGTTDRDAAAARSFLGTHLILTAGGARFLSVIDPPSWARDAAGACEQHRCWPVLAGEDSDANGVVLASPIILYDNPEVAPESAGALFDSTEIDEILTLRVMTLTDEEKAAARATDPRAAAIIDRCDRLTPADLQRLHGILRDPRAGTGAFAPFDDPVPTWTTPAEHDTPWWSPEADASVDPATDAVRVDGVEVRRGSLVRLRPNRRADAQDLFFAGQVARVAAVLEDVDGCSHVAVVLADDPGADLHEWYGRYLYFAPDELEPVGGQSCERSES